MGLVGLTLQAVDGTKIQAAAHAGKKYDKEDLAKRIERLDEQLVSEKFCNWIIMRRSVNLRSE